jgi:hypothetical protein
LSLTLWTHENLAKWGKMDRIKRKTWNTWIHFLPQIPHAENWQTECVDTPDCKTVALFNWSWQINVNTKGVMKPHNWQRQLTKTTMFFRVKKPVANGASKCRPNLDGKLCTPSIVGNGCPCWSSRVCSRLPHNHNNNNNWSHIACNYFRTSISQLTQWNNRAIHPSLRWSHRVKCLTTLQQPSQHMNLHAWPTRFTVLNSTEKGEFHSHLSDQKTQSQICTTWQAGLATTWNLLQTQWELVFDCDGAMRLLSLAHSGMDWPHSTYHQNIRKLMSKKTLFVMTTWSRSQISF